MRRTRKHLALTALAVGILILSALPSEAQRRVIVRRPVRHAIVLHAGFHASPFYASPFYTPFFWGGPWSPYPMAFYGQWYPGPRDRAAVQLQVKPREAQVYVDGYFAGTVDDFDGALQRLRVRSGDREITIYLQGYRTIRETVRLSPGQDLKIQRQMEPLAEGETNEPPPTPVAGAEDDPRGADDPREGPPRQGAPPDRPGLRPPPAPPRPSWPEAPAPQAPAAGFGTIALRVQPEGAEVLIDGERWEGPEGHERMSVQVAEGRHRIEIRREGFVTYSGEVEVRQGETTPVNVSLPPRRN